jgi:hypothetical protein
MCKPLCGCGDVLDEDVGGVACEAKRPIIGAPGEVDFGNVRVGTTTAAQTLTIRNTGNDTLRLTGLTYRPPAGDFAALAPPAAAIAAAGSTTIDVTFTPTARGLRRLYVDIDSNDPDTPQVTLALRGTGCAPTIDVPAQLDFGKRAIGATPTMSVTIRNTGNADLVLGAIQFPGDFAADPANVVVNGTTIVPGATADLQVKFTPAAVGVKHGDLTIASNDPDHASVTVVLDGEQVQPSLELFRANTILTLVPFATTDIAAELDSALPDLQQRVAAPGGRPANLAADFEFPPVASHATNATADADAQLFRVRLKHAPVAFVQQDVVAVLKVLDSTGTAITGITGFRFAALACHPDGMQITLRQNGDVWESPYLRVATTVDALSKGAFGIVHSPAPATTLLDAAMGKQFGRRMTATIDDVALAPAPVTRHWTMGGEPYARVPIRFTWIDDAPPSDPKKKVAYGKLADANAYWAGSGLEFVLVGHPLVPFSHSGPPQRRLLVIGDFTGCDEVSPHAFTVDLGLTLTVGVTPHLVAISCPVLANSDGPTTAAAIRQAIRAWAGAGPLAGMTLDADIYSFPHPRVFLNYGGLSVTGTPQALPAVGTHGPTDLTLRQALGAALAKLEITSLLVRRAGVNPDRTIDIHVPPVAQPFHDAMLHPPSGATRHWIRSFGPANEDHVSVVVETPNYGRRMGDAATPAALCEDGMCALYDADLATRKTRFVGPLQGDIPSSTAGPVALLSFGRWAQPFAKLIVTMSHDTFSAAANDLQHELGHTLGDRNHTINEPAWFYDGELMHPSGPALGKANRRTRHKVLVDTIQDNGGTWEAYYEELATGYGGAMRARIAAIAQPWLVPLAPGQPAW